MNLLIETKALVVRKGLKILQREQLAVHSLK